MLPKYARPAPRAFTLIELLVVIVIIGILATIVVTRVVHRTEDARVASAIATIRAFDDQLQVYYLDTHSYPSSDQGLAALISPPAGATNWHGPYLKNASTVPLDPWGNPYVYKQPGDDGRDYDIVSAGPDGQLGTADDIKSYDIKR